MTRKEAIDAIKCNYPPEHYSMLREALDMAIKELKRPQTTKYKHIGTRVTYWGKHKYIFKCETCGLTKEFTDNHTAQYKYCPSCGRKIDWSKPKGNDCDVMFIDEVIAYDTQKKD